MLSAYEKIEFENLSCILELDRTKYNNRQEVVLGVKISRKFEIKIVLKKLGFREKQICHPKMFQLYFLGNEAANGKVLLYTVDLSLHVERTSVEYLVHLTNFQTRFSPRLNLK